MGFEVSILDELDWVKRPLDPHTPLTTLVAGDMPVRVDGRRLIDSLEAPFALAHGLDGEAPETSGL